MARSARTFGAPDIPSLSQLARRSLTVPQKMLSVVILGAFAALAQSTGDIWPGLVYVISPLATLPVMIGAILGLKTGFAVYTIAAMALLTAMQPLESVIFMLTTGLLGLSIGLGYRIFRARHAIAACGAFGLLTGTLTMMRSLRFPLLGTFTHPLKLLDAALVVLLACLYSGLWVLLSRPLMQGLGRLMLTVSRSSRET